MKKHIELLSIQDDTIKNLDPTDPEFIYLTHEAADVNVWIAKESELTDEIAQKVEIVCGWPPAEFVRKCTNLKWLHLPTAGTEFYCDPTLYCKPIILTNAKGVFGQHIAEHILALLLGLTRRMRQYVQNMDQPVWQLIEPLRDIHGSTVGILGCGNIGLSLAERLRPFGCKQIIGLKRDPNEKLPYFDRIVGMESLDELVGICDFLILCLPSTPQTQGVLSRERLFSMKKNAVIINVSRGALIDQEALVDALSSGLLAGAGLDVTTPEPLPYEHPLWKLPNVIITPHAAFMSLSNVQIKMKVFNENLKRYINGDKLLNVVDFDLKY